jgi:hypothetical protein
MSGGRNPEANLLKNDPLIDHLEGKIIPSGERTAGAICSFPDRLLVLEIRRRDSVLATGPMFQQTKRMMTELLIPLYSGIKG